MLNNIRYTALCGQNDDGDANRELAEAVTSRVSINKGKGARGKGAMKSGFSPTPRCQANQMPVGAYRRIQIQTINRPCRKAFTSSYWKWFLFDDGMRASLTAASGLLQVTGRGGCSACGAVGLSSNAKCKKVV